MHALNDPLALRLTRLLLIVLLGQLAATARADDPVRLTVVTDRKDAVYETGDTAKFVVEVTRGGERVKDGTVSYVVDDFITPSLMTDQFPQGELPLGRGRSISISSAKPGFIRCRVTYQGADKKLQATAAAAFSPRKIQPSMPTPDDFDAFWDAQKQQLAKVAMDVKQTPVKYANAEIECFDLQVACAGGAPVSGFLAKPKDAKPKSLPAILWVHGAGVRSSSLSNAAAGAKAGMLSLDINAHGIPNGKPAQFYKDQAAGPLKDYRFAGRESRNTIYFRGMYLRLVRAIDFLTAQPEWDGKVVAVIGHSQGGGQALVAGGIDDRVTFVATGVPAICDHSGRAAERINGWPKLVPTGVDGKPEPSILEAARYVDAVNFASRCRADAIMSVGFIDAVCPPSSCYAAFNELQGNKEVINEPLMGHAAPPHIRTAFFQRIQEHVRERTSPERRN